MGNCSEKRRSVPELFGSSVFNDDVMQERLPKDVYQSLRKTIDQGKDLDLNVANAVASAMKDWAVEKGTTHYTHWFQPLNGITAEKHDSFISPTSDGRVIMQFSGKELIKGEPDASSFPSGGLRATFEARGYTAWDPTSYAFVKGDSLYIPTAYCSYSGEVLDKKTPLLRSMEDLNVQALRILRILGDDRTNRVIPTVGAEQEYFLIDRKLYEQRKDLIFCGRTLFGVKAPKGQELEDHYFGAIKPRVSAFMKELDEELWKLGILAKTKHNEAAPAQHELAPIFATTNIATDHNQLTMETMKNVAARHGLVCLLHEKPFYGVNGSGKHNNWSLSTDGGKNLLDPGKSPNENMQFLLFLAAMVQGVDEYQDLLRISVASAGNDHRLGAHEAPPAIISIFLGDELTGILEAIENDRAYDSMECQKLETGVHVLPDLNKDTTDRNRTSPFAFTGNKFEFRSLGSAISIACPNIMLNTIMAEELRRFADQLEQTADLKTDVLQLVKKVMQKHKRIIFNGDGYSEEWVQEAKRRGLLNLRTTVDALPRYLDQKNVELFANHKIYTEAEMEARYETILEEYAKTLNIEALTMIEMVRQDILPSVSAYIAKLSNAILSKRSVSQDIPCATELSLVKKLSFLADSAYEKLEALEAVLADPKTVSVNVLTVSTYYRDAVIPAMDALRADVDQMEWHTASSYWPYPGYEDLMFQI
ncbi:glutamine synthetase III [Neglectibacter timonensis]|uniref:Glutamine synthetase III n=1 Tax=Neglectibacter timonensis TaxID=1776382 RepID=A0ABT1S0Y7_9FIRM|nr:glutamine synthetase III [Neglectibacter timonensis]MCQ4840607.1 glutamine synthetase III [Neglectibacter timonensis]MCQ4844781.1 glutamine synthetase III [Neglectibacter timonensis]